jgi:hypothetical protein
MGKHTQDNLQSDVPNPGATDDSDSSAILYNSDKISPIKYSRLPCRGCLASCKNYHLCDGKLWRMAR